MRDSCSNESMVSVVGYVMERCRRSFEVAHQCQILGLVNVCDITRWDWGEGGEGGAEGGDGRRGGDEQWGMGVRRCRGVLAWR